MSKFLVARLLTVIPMLLVVTVLVFILLAAVPGDPAARLAGENPTVEQLTAIRKDLGLDRPLYAQYGSWVGKAVRGDLGESILYKRPVTTFIAERLPVTASLAAVTLLFTILVAIPLGLIGALRPGSVVDRVIAAVCAFFIATPPFIVGATLVLFLAIRHSWLPPTGYEALAQGGVWNWFKHLILPAIAIAFSSIAELSRQVRAALIDAMGQAYVRTAQAKGLLGRQVLLKHALKNASIPIVTVLALQMGRVLSGAVIVEFLFALPGLGTLAVEAVFNRDVPMIQGVVLISALAVIVANLLADASYAYFNPRLRSS